ncbi:hypothetical protein FH972_015270 [Carpinus fangiana]|uniref:Uncharacterized protein n=1 Tax=Carpinus fangiana TaxID=176857 RepID=A0A5N6RCA3_9ROSI|nr:hypothetical protein FH972_015270 [Carpinus fangiana]
MAPAQPFMDIDLDIKPPIAAKMALDKEKRSSQTNSDGKGLRCKSNCGGTNIETQAMLDDQTKALKCPEDLEVDIIGCTVKSEIRSIKREDPDATEYSSSFADTTSNNENCSGLSEGEVESQLFGDDSLASAFDAFSSSLQMRKKKLTNHWRNFIRPLMWRCKWTELKIKEIESQALKYSREIAAYDQRKHLGFDQLTSEGLGSKSLPFSRRCYRKKAIKRRRKRKRVENTADITSYMSQHNLFSYLEIKKSDPDGNLLADDFGNPVITDQNDDCNDKFGIGNNWSFLEFRDGEQILEQVLWKIEMVHSRVHKLKSQIDMVLSKNAARFSSSENLSLLALCDAQTSSAHSPTFSAGNGDNVSVGPVYSPTKNVSECDNVDLVMPGSAILSYGETIHVPDIIESTVGLLSAADVTLHQPQIGDSCEDIVDSVLVNSEAGEAEKDSFKKVGSHSTEMHQEAEIGDQEESTNPPSIPTSEPLTVAKSVGPQEQSSLSSCLASEVHFPRNKRKRGERKAGSVGWSKKSSGEPDSQ